MVTDCKSALSDFDFGAAGSIVGSKYTKVDNNTTNSTSIRLGPIGQIGVGAAVAALPEVFAVIFGRSAGAVFR